MRPAQRGASSSQVGFEPMAKLLTPQQEEDIRTLHWHGISTTEIASRFACSQGTIRRVVSPEVFRKYEEKRNKLLAESRKHLHSPDGKMASRVQLDIAARFAEIPIDRRSLTATAFGDPIPNDPRRHWCPWLNRGTV